MAKKSMDQVSAQPVKYDIGGKEYKLRPLKMGELLGEASSMVRQQAIKDLQIAAKMENPGAKRDLLARVALKAVPVDSCFEWMSSWEGLLWLVSKSIVPSMTIAEVSQSFSVEEIDNASDMIATISGMRGEVDDDKGEGSGEPESDFPIDGESESP